jgi:hypothetical protein
MTGGEWRVRDGVSSFDAEAIERAASRVREKAHVALEHADGGEKAPTGRETD